MKKTTLLSALALAVIIACLSSSCSKRDDSVAASAEINSTLELYSSTISKLQGQIDVLTKEQEEESKAKDKEISELKAQLEELKKQNEPQTPPQSDQTKPEGSTEEALGFKYIVSGDNATITAYEGNESKIVIPTTINGYKVTSIADGAFENLSISNVIISDGIESIGWFAFNGCASLKSITIPSSVKSIGYSAFGVAGSSLTIYCHSESFALSYAKSYGLTYTVI